MLPAPATEVMMISRRFVLSLAIALFVRGAQAADDDARPELPAKVAGASEAKEAAADTKQADAKQAETVEEKKPPEPGHSMHGEAFDEGPRQKPYLMAGMAAVHFPITTKSTLAQQFFDQGVAQLHGFWYFEAERSFRQVAALDPDCGMAYWGLAMANANNEKRAKKFSEQAVAKKSGGSSREAAWIDALAATYVGEDTEERRRKYIRDLEALTQDDPNDAEAKAFLALQIWKNGSWMTDKKKQLPISSHQAVDALLDQVFALNPVHPAQHYRIHLWDDEKPARALVAASLCGQTSPGIAHMWHMPGHTFSKLHRYADAAWQQEASARVDHAHMMRDGILPDQIHNYAHNNEWLIRNLAFLGRKHDAIALAENMIALPRHPKYNMPDKRGSSSAFGKLRLSELLEQYECWEAVLGDAGKLLFAVESADFEARRKQARLVGLAQFGLGNSTEGQAQIAALEALLTEQRTERVKSADEAEAKAREEKKSDAEATKAMTDVLQSKGKELRKTERAISELKTYAALGRNDAPAAKLELEKIKKDAEIRKEHLARLFSLVGDHTQAEALAREQVKDSPGQIVPLAGLVEVLYRAEKKAEARKEFEQLRDLAADADLDARIFRRLDAIAREFGWPEDWRNPRQPALDVGQRPDLAKLGPFRWAPTPATNWTLPSAKGEKVSLQDFNGRPLLVIFYLGSGCLHCVEQIQKLAPENDNFEAAGISLVAISSEPLDTLQGSLAKLSPDEKVPFALAADPELEVFKAYRAHDDFENAPLHGVFLIDAAGLIRWHDISYEPFTDAKFLLEESKRLLGKSPEPATP